MSIKASGRAFTIGDLFQHPLNTVGGISFSDVTSYLDKQQQIKNNKDIMQAKANEANSQAQLDKSMADKYEAQTQNAYNTGFNFMHDKKILLIAVATIATTFVLFMLRGKK